MLQRIISGGDQDQLLVDLLLTITSDVDLRFMSIYLCLIFIRNAATRTTQIKYLLLILRNILHYIYANATLARH